MKTYPVALKKFILFIIIGLSVSNISAQWESLGGLNELPITCFANSDWGIFACSSIDGIYLSADNGNTWIETDNGETEGIIYALAVNGQYIFAGSDVGVYVSPDAGYNWTLEEKGWPSGVGVASLLISGTNIFAGTFGNGLYLSTDSGNSWKSVEGVERPEIYSLVTMGSEIFAGTDVYVYASMDNGASWTIPDSGIGPGGISLALSGSNIYAGTYSGVYVSGNDGLLWRDVTGLEGYEIYALAAAGSQLYAGTLNPLSFSNSDTVFTTGNGWVADNGGLENDGYIHTITLIGSSLFLGAENGAWKLPNALLSVSQIENPRSFISIYPNPASSSFTIETTANGSQQLQIFDITGQLLLSQPIQNSKTTIDASSLAAGVYMVCLKGEEVTSTQKLVLAK